MHNELTPKDIQMMREELDYQMCIRDSYNIIRRLQV